MTPAKTTATPDTAALEAELIALHGKYETLPEEIDVAIVALTRGGWTQAAIAAEMGCIPQEVARRFARCGNCDPDWSDTDPEYLNGLYAEWCQLTPDIDAVMAALVDAGYSYGDVGAVINVSKQAVGPRVKRHREATADG